MPLAETAAHPPVVRPDQPFLVAVPSFDRLDPAPLPDGWVIDGDPAPRMAILTSSHDATLMSGVWECGAGRFHFRYDFDETVHVISGSVEVTVGQCTEVLVPGSVAYFPRGISSVWQVQDHVRKYFVQRNPSRLERVTKRLGTRVTSAASALFP